VAAAQAQVAQKQADLDFARLQLSYATVTAPSSGIVSKKNVEVGQLVQAGQPLMAIVQDRNVWVVANYKETQLRRMRVGQRVTFEVDAIRSTPSTAASNRFRPRRAPFAPSAGQRDGKLHEGRAARAGEDRARRPSAFSSLRGMSVTTIVDLD
jgi:multidrug resistance efflux pump